MIFLSLFSVLVGRPQQARALPRRPSSPVPSEKNGFVSTTNPQQTKNAARQEDARQEVREETAEKKPKKDSCVDAYSRGASELRGALPDSLYFRCGLVELVRRRMTTHKPTLSPSRSSPRRAPEANNNSPAADRRLRGLISAVSPSFFFSGTSASQHAEHSHGALCCWANFGFRRSFLYINNSQK